MTDIQKPARIIYKNRSELYMNTRLLRPGACYWYTGRGRREMVRYRYREADGWFVFDSDEGQSVSLTADRVERYLQGA